MDLIKVAEEAFATGKQFPEFGPGDTITVAYKIIEGSKERIQLYRGVCIKISGQGEVVATKLSVGLFAKEVMYCGGDGLAGLLVRANCVYLIAKHAQRLEGYHRLVILRKIAAEQKNFLCHNNFLLKFFSVPVGMILL